MKIIFSGVFAPNSSNYGQAKGFEELGHEVVRFEYREVAKNVGPYVRDSRFIDLCKREQPDLILLSKGDHMHSRVVTETRNIAPVAIWYMDAPGPNLNSEQITKMSLAQFTFCAHAEVVKMVKRYNDTATRIVEGVWGTEFFVTPAELPEQDIDVSFFGDLRPDRRHYKDLVGFTHVNGIYREDLAKFIARSKINLNFCTERCGSNRIYCVLSVGGFLMTDDWTESDQDFEIGKDLVIFDNANDLKEKAAYYLKHEDERLAIARNGHEANKKFSQRFWAESILKGARLI